MKNYLVSLYSVEKNVWRCKSSNVYDEKSFNRVIKRIKSDGFVFDSESRCFVYTHVFPDATFSFVYIVSDIPSNL